MEVSNKSGLGTLIKHHHLLIVTTFAVTALFAAMFFLFYYRYNHLRIKGLENKISSLETEKSVITKTYCKGKWENNVCIENTCIDSDVNEKPDDIYTRGSVTYIDITGKEITEYDECTGSNNQVNEMWCYESPSGSGNFTVGKLVYDCIEECNEGACQRSEKTDEDMLKEVLGARHSKFTPEISLTIDKKTSNYAFGTVSFAGETDRNWWLGVKTSNLWEIISEGNGTILCSDIEPYNFPANVVEECYDDTTGELISR